MNMHLPPELAPIIVALAATPSDHYWFVGIMLASLLLLARLLR